MGDRAAIYKKACVYSGFVARIIKKWLMTGPFAVQRRIISSDRRGWCFQIADGLSATWPGKRRVEGGVKS